MRAPRWGRLIGCVLLAVGGAARGRAQAPPVPRAPVPDKVVVLTFDDAVVSHATRVAPLLKRYGFGATFFVTEFVQPPFADSSLYMTWAQIGALNRMGFEIGNHTAHHTHVTRMDRAQLVADLAYIEQKGAAVGIPRMRSFAYPAYETTPSAVETLRGQGYTFARVGGNRTYDPAHDDPLLVPSFSTSGANRDQIMRAFAEARGGNIVVLTVHGVPDSAHPWVSTPPALFDEYLRYLHDNGYTVLALRDLARYVDPAAPNRPTSPAPSAGPAAGAFDVRAFGARGDGTTLDTDAINRAVAAAAAAGGGTVYFPAGTYASYSVRLRSNVALYLDAGATLLAAEPANGRGYDAAEPGAGNAYQDFGHSHWHNSLLWGEDVANVSILGPGRIDGRGLNRGLTFDSAGVAHDLAQNVPGLGNKAVALVRARNVLLRDVSIYRGGHFAVLATGVDNLTVDHLTIDTNRDGIDVDACRNVRVTNASVNTPNDDAIVLKSSYALGAARGTEGVTISDSFVSGYDLGSLLDGTFRRTQDRAPDREGPAGRIKLGTESNGAFRNVTITNVVFERSRGLALETVDGAVLEDVVVSNLTMREVTSAPLFLRLGARMRGPAGTPVGALRRVTISNVVASDVDPRYPAIIAGLPGHPVEDVRISNVRIRTRGGLTLADAARQPAALVNTFFRPAGGSGPREPYAVPEREAMYPEPSMFGVLPAHGFYVRHARGIVLDGVDVSTATADGRPAFVLDDVGDVELSGVRAGAPPGVPTVVLRDVEAFRSSHSRALPDTVVRRAARQTF